VTEERENDDASRFGIIAQQMDMMESYAISAKEAARRHEAGTLEMHLRQLRRELMAAIAQFKEIEGGRVADAQ
jgi:hypothetical protein